MADPPREYPIAGALDARALLVGSIDLLVVSLEAVSVIDFKTDAPPVGDVQASHASYVAQVKSYGRLLASGAFVGDRELRHGLLFTADGSLHWV